MSAGMRGTQCAPQLYHLGRTVGNLGIDDQEAEIRVLPRIAARMRTEQQDALRVGAVR
jgi:hypothetical protein